MATRLVCIAGMVICFGLWALIGYWLEKQFEAKKS